MKIKKDMEIVFKFAEEDKEYALHFRNNLHKQFVGNQDYIDSKIVISDSDTTPSLKDGNNFCVCLVVGNDVNTDTLPDHIDIDMTIIKDKYSDDGDAIIVDTSDATSISEEIHTEVSENG